MSIAQEVSKLFLDELALRNIPATASPEGGYDMLHNGMKLHISLDNLTRDFANDRDVGRVTRFVDTITAGIYDPTWEEAESRVRWQLESVEMPVEDALHDVVSDQVALVLVYISPDEMQITWVTQQKADKWRQTKESLMATAAENMAKILAEATIQIEPVDEHRLGMLSTELVAFKAALLYTPGLRAKIEPVLGWPILAVMPCRDFVYLIPEVDRDLLGRVGPVVVRENAESGYPVCTEVFEITDQGLRATGEFQKQPTPNADGMKTIHYRGGIVNFRLPEHWLEEYEEEGGGTFYDEDSENGTLRLNVLTFASKTPLTPNTAREMAEQRAANHHGTAHDLGHGNWMFYYTEAHDDDEFTMHYWNIINPLPPDDFRVVIYSYTVATDLLDDDEVIEELAIVDREIRASTFAAEIGE
jgi:hypothetical protein